MEPIITYSLFHVLVHKLHELNTYIHRLKNISRFSEVDGVCMGVCDPPLNPLLLLLLLLSSTSDLQPSTPPANQLPGQLVSTEIRTMYKYKF